MLTNTRRWLSAITVALAGTVLLHGTLESQNARYEYVAVVHTAAQRQGAVTAGGITWTCDSKSCTVTGPWEEPGVTSCAALAREVGRIVSYGRKGRLLDANALEECNRGVSTTAAIAPSAGGIKAPVMRMPGSVVQAPPPTGPAGRPPAAGGIQAPPPTGPVVRPSSGGIQARAGSIGPRDADGDGHERIEGLRGDDCDDNDPKRYPGAIEVPDTVGHDEDCNLETFGWVDADHDGHADARYLNRNASGSQFSGDDCDDSRSSVHPAQVEVCNLVDDNCNGEVDEGVQMRAWRDEDHDLYGDPGAEVMVCPTQLGPGIVTNNFDCDDANPRRNPYFGNCS